MVLNSIYVHESKIIRKKLLTGVQDTQCAVRNIVHTFYTYSIQMNFRIL